MSVIDRTLIVSMSNVPDGVSDDDFVAEAWRKLRRRGWSCGEPDPVVEAQVVDVQAAEQVGWDNPASWPVPWVRLSGCGSPDCATPVYRPTS